jgi:hypothetical protein
MTTKRRWKPLSSSWVKTCAYVTATAFLARYAYTSSTSTSYAVVPDASSSVNKFDSKVLDDDDDDADVDDDAERRRRARGGWSSRLWRRWCRWAISVLLVPLSTLLSRGRAGLGDADADAYVDPSLPIYVVGATSCRALERKLGKELWLWFIDALGVSKSSAGRAHIAQLLSHPDTKRSLDETFDELARRYPTSSSSLTTATVSAEGLVAFSDGIRGSIRGILENHRRAVEIGSASESEHAFLRDNFELLFPEEDPLDREAFHALAKLIMVRRIIKALVRDFGGLTAIQRGLSQPLVVDVVVVLDGDVVFRVHTVAPKSAAAAVSGQRLGIIAED